MDRPINILNEFEDANLGDQRLENRLAKIVTSVEKSPEKSFPTIASSDAELEAIYRFVNNDRVSMDAILQPHITESYRRASEAGKVLVLHDTTEFIFDGVDRPELGYLKGGKRGFLGHVALLVSADGYKRPLGIGGVETLFREKKQSRTKKKKRQRLSGADYAKMKNKESDRWPRMVDNVHQSLCADTEAVHVMDAEGDSYSLISKILTNGRRFVIRVARDRIVDSSPDDSQIWEHLDQVIERIEGQCEREVPLSKRKATTAPKGRKKNPPRKYRKATLQFSATSIAFRRPRYLNDEFPPSLRLNIVRVFEPNAPKDEKAVEWRLISTEPIQTIEQVLEIVDFYRTRWLIEEYFRALKTGCAYRKRQFEGRNALLNTLAILAPLAWQILALRNEYRYRPDAPASVLFSEQKLRILRTMTKRPLPENPTVKEVLYSLAAEGGHLKRNGEPGWQTLCRGMEKLIWAEYGYDLAQKERGEM